MQRLHDARKDAASSPDSLSSPWPVYACSFILPVENPDLCLFIRAAHISSPLSLSFLPRSSPTSSRSSLGRGRGLRFSKHGLTPSSPGTRPALLDYKSSAELDTPAKVTLTALIKLSPEEKLGLGRNNIGPRFHLFRRDPSRKYVRS